MRMVHVELTGRICGDAEHRSDGKVDVARDDDDGLPDREKSDDRCARKDLLHIRRAEEEVIVDRRRTDHEHECEHDAELTEAEHRLRKRM